MQPSIVRVAAWLVTIALVLVLIVVGESYLVPIFVALVIWYLVNALNEQFRTLPFIGARLPNALTLGLSLTFIGLTLYFVSDMIVETVNGFIVESPKYLPRIDAQIARGHAMLGLAGEPPTLAGLRLDRQLWTNASLLVNGITTIARGFFLVLLYVLFFLIEQNVFPKKMAALGLSLETSKRLSFVLREINQAMRTYLGVKTFTSALTAIASFIVLSIIGLDYALFWAFLIFLFNYVPTIGSITATFLPAALALVQFDSLTPFLVVVIGVTAIQLAVGNILEPRLMGSTLNISPLVVVLSLILWSVLWGVIGMLLSVPITVMVIIICAQFPETKPVAVLLSRNGELKVTPKKKRKPRKKRSFKSRLILPGVSSPPPPRPQTEETADPAEAN